MMQAASAVAVSIQQGRRATDWIVQFVRGVRQNTLAIFQIWKDERGYWSTRRILLWVWTWLGAWAIYREVAARVYVINETIINPHFLSNAWIQAWTITEGAFIVAVFGPVVADYLKNAAPAIAAIGGALRDKIGGQVVNAEGTATEPVTVTVEAGGSPASTPNSPAFGGNSQ